ncbi:MAG: PH domain-containing protein [Microgenomates group bacterium]
MPRIKDVDNVAPDDLITSPKTNLTINTNPIIKSPNKLVDTETLNDKVYSIFGHTKSSFSSALVFPHVFSFAEQDDDEKILVAMRPHWFTNVSWIFTSIFLFLLPSLIHFVPLINTLPWNYQFVITLSWYLIAIAYTFEKFMGWYFDVYIITDRRVIDIDFINLLTKKYAEADISKIQDVSSKVSGVSQTFFNYGSVLIQTASEVNELHFDKVANPEKIVKILQELGELEESKHHE